MDPKNLVFFFVKELMLVVMFDIYSLTYILKFIESD